MEGGGAQDIKLRQLVRRRALVLGHLQDTRQVHTVPQHVYQLQQNQHLHHVTQVERAWLLIIIATKIVTDIEKKQETLRYV